MGLKKFEYLKTIAEYKSITKASEKLYISHQALSKAMQNLEEEYGVTLFTRTPFGVELTEDGKEFLDASLQILAIHNRLKERFKKDEVLINTKNRVHLEMGGTFKYYKYLFSESMYKFQNENKNFNVQLRKMPRKAIVKGIEDGIIDIGFLPLISVEGKDLFQLPKDVEFIPISQMNTGIILSKKLLFSKKKKISLKNYREYPFVVIDDDINDNLEEFIFYDILKSYGIDDIYMASASVQMNMLKDGRAVTIGSIDEVESITYGNNELISIPLKEKIIATNGYIVRKDNVAYYEIIQFIEKFTEYINENINKIISQE